MTIYKTSHKDIAPRFIDSVIFGLKALYRAGRQMYFVLIGMMLLIAIAGFLKRYPGESAENLLREFALLLLIGPFVFLGIFFFIFLVTIPFFRRTHYEYGDIEATRVSPFGRTTFLYNKLESVRIAGKYKLFVTFTNHTDFPKIVSFSWFGNELGRMYEFIDFLISRNSNVRDKLYIQNFRDSFAFHMPFEKRDELLMEFYSLPENN